jgi:hypothetical protein
MRVVAPPNARVQRLAAWRGSCSARGVTRECVRWNALLAGPLRGQPIFASKYAMSVRAVLTYSSASSGGSNDGFG